MLFGSYRRGDANDPDAYVAAVAAVLAMYDTDLIREVTDPRTGIATTEKYMSFMPNAGELKVYCDGVAARKERIQRLGSLPPLPARVQLPPPEPQPGDKANVFVAAIHNRYARLVEWSKQADPRLWRFGKSSDGRDGIWVAFGILEERGQVEARTLAETVRQSLPPRTSLPDIGDFDGHPADPQTYAEVAGRWENEILDEILDDIPWKTVGQ